MPTIDEAGEYRQNLVVLIVRQAKARRPLVKDIVEAVTQPVILPLEPKLPTDLLLREVVSGDSPQVVLSCLEQVASVGDAPVEIGQELEATAIAPY